MNKDYRGKMSNVITLVYYGEKFYTQSGTHLGVLYTEDGERASWNTVPAEIAKGYEVRIRAATDAEYGAMCKHLDAYLAERKRG